MTDHVWFSLVLQYADWHHHNHHFREHSTEEHRFSCRTQLLGTVLHSELPRPKKHTGTDPQKPVLQEFIVQRGNLSGRGSKAQHWPVLLHCVCCRAGRAEERTWGHPAVLQARLREGRHELGAGKGSRGAAQLRHSLMSPTHAKRHVGSTKGKGMK